MKNIKYNFFLMTLIFYWHVGQINTLIMLLRGSTARLNLSLLFL